MDHDQVMAELRSLVATHGWAVRLVNPPPGETGWFAYTVGLTEHGLPEVIERGLPPEVGQQFLNLVAAEMTSGRTISAPSIVRDLTEGGHPIAFLPVLDTSDLSAATELYSEVSAIQLVWSDSAGRLPWDPGFGPGPDGQPLMGRWIGG